MRKYRKKRKSFKAFSREFREKVRYFFYGPYLEEGEVIVDLFHSHPIVIMKNLVKVFFIGIFIPVFLAFVFPEIAFFCVIWLAIGFIRLGFVFLDWYHDTILVTQSTLIDIQWKGLFTRLSMRLEFSSIEGITTEIKGPLQLFLNYGNIMITTEGGSTQFVLEEVRYPRYVEMKILEYQGKYLSKKQFQDAHQLKLLIATMLKNNVLDKKTPSSVRNK